MAHMTSDAAHRRHFNAATAEQKPTFVGENWPVAIVALGMALTVIWMAAVVWFFVTATADALPAIG